MPGQFNETAHRQTSFCICFKEPEHSLIGVLYTNCVSFLSKRDELDIFMSRHKLNIILLTKILIMNILSSFVVVVAVVVVVVVVFLFQHFIIAYDHMVQVFASVSPLVL